MLRSHLRPGRLALLALPAALWAAALAATRSDDRELQQRASPLRFEIVYPTGVHAGPLDGRVLLVIARSDRAELRFQTGWGLNSQPIFGVDVEGLRPGEPAVIGASNRGYAVETVRSRVQVTLWPTPVVLANRDRRPLRRTPTAEHHRTGATKLGTQKICAVIKNGELLGRAELLAEADA